jgi:hypothetical protein
MQKATQSTSAQFFIAQRKRILPPLLNQAQDKNST